MLTDGLGASLTYIRENLSTVVQAVVRQASSNTLSTQTTDMLLSTVIPWTGEPTFEVVSRTIVDCQIYPEVISIDDNDDDVVVEDEGDTDSVNFNPPSPIIPAYIKELEDSGDLGLDEEEERSSQSTTTTTAPPPIIIDLTGDDDDEVESATQQPVVDEEVQEVSTYTLSLFIIF